MRPPEIRRERSQSAPVTRHATYREPAANPLDNPGVTHGLAFGYPWVFGSAPRPDDDRTTSTARPL